DTHGRPVCADGHTRTSSTNVLCVLTDTHGHTRTATDVLCVLTDSHRRHPRTSCVCWWTPTDVLCVLNRLPTWAKITQTSTGRVRVLSPRTNVLICVLMDSHGRPVHISLMCADGHPQTSCVCCRTPTDVLCVLNRQPRLAKITRTVHRKGQRAESKDQRADMCTDGQPRMSSTDVLCVLTDTHGHTQTATDILCVLTDTHGRRVHGRPVCADGHTRTHTDSDRCPVCADGQPQTATDVLCVLADTHGRPVYSPRGPKSPEQSTGRASVLSPRTNVLICVLMDSHRRPVCADGHTRTHTDSHGRPMCAGRQRRTPRGLKSPEKSTGRVSVRSPRTNVLICVLMDSHGRPVCADGHTQTATDVLCVLNETHERPVYADGHPRTSFTHTDTHGQPRTSCVCWRTATDILCVLNRQPTWAKITQTVHGKGQRADVLSPRTNVLICVLMDSHGRPVCPDRHRRTQPDTHEQPHTSCVCWRTATDILCVLNRQPTWAKITRTVHGKGQRAESKDQRSDMCTDGQPRTSCVC
ncbi:unnamed protein product, partial [Brassica rapa]